MPVLKNDAASTERRPLRSDRAHGVGNEARGHSSDAFP